MNISDEISTSAYRLYFQSESCITVSFNTTNSSEKIYGLKDYILQNPFQGWVECVPTFTTLSIYFDPFVTSENVFKKIENLVDEYLSSGFQQNSITKKILNIPVCYEGIHAPDLAWAATVTQLKAEEIIRIHTAQEYKVLMLGFVPGFPYMGIVDERIQLPRLSAARGKVPSGSVGIAGAQTGIYPSVIPGGWPVIGRTPLRIFDKESAQPFLLSAGDFVQFYAISEQEFSELNQHPS